MDTIETEGAGVAEQADVEQRMVSLHLCRYGQDYPDGAINPRKHDRWASEALIASVREDGIIQPPLAKERDGLFYFAAGSRRLHALFAVHAPHINDSGYPVPWSRVEGVMVPIIMRRNSNPLALGLQENLNRNNLHPVDKMEGFAALLAGRDGVAPMTVEEIAAHYSMRVAQVRMSLRLGALAPEIRERWRAGQLEGATAEAFILCRDLKQQLKILARLDAKVGPGGRITPHHVRAALKAQPGEVRRLLTFVGRDTAIANGIEVSESLFSFAAVRTDAEGAQDAEGEPTVANFAALKALAEESLATAAGILTELSNKEGGPWAWAKPASAMPAGWQSWARMELGRKLSIKDRESVGCVVSIDGEGKLHTEEAIYWPELPAPKASGDGATANQGESSNARADGEPPTVREGGHSSAGLPPEEGQGVGEAAPLAAASGGDASEDGDGKSALTPWMQERLAEQLQAGLAKALEGRNDLALPVLLAAVLSAGDVVEIAPITEPVTVWPFEEALERYAAMDLGAQLRALAGVVSTNLNLTIRSGETPPGFMAGPRMLMKVMAAKMGAPKVKARLVEAFDLDAYVKAAPKDLLITAIGEACGDAQAMNLTGQGIGKVRAFALENLRARKWLPAELWDLDVVGSGAPKRKQPIAKVVRKVATHRSAGLRKRKAKKSAKRGR